jgi:radical SAM-linked protein
MSASADHDPPPLDPAPDRAPETGVSVVVEFRVSGLARYLSHAELMRVFVRAAIRSGLTLEYSHGYNPRPRLSVPLPKPVGIESEGDLCCVQVKARPDSDEDAARRFSEQWPQGIELMSVRIAPRKASYQAEAADYRFSLKEALRTDELRNKALALLASESLVVDRRDGDGRAAWRRVDVRPFLDSVDVADRGVGVHYRIFPTGSIRVGEALDLLGLTQEDLAGPIRRTAIRWCQTR